MVTRTQMGVLNAREFIEMCHKNKNGYRIFFDDREDARALRMACYGIKSRERKKQDTVFHGNPEYISNCAMDDLRFEIRRTLDGRWELRGLPVDIDLKHTEHGPIPDEPEPTFKNEWEAERYRRLQALARSRKPDG